MSDTAQGAGWWLASDGTYYPPQPGPTPPRTPVYKRVWFWVLVVVALLLAGCVTLVNAAPSILTDANRATHTVTYSVTGDGTSDITYAALTSNNGLRQSQPSSTALPWTKTVVASGILSSYVVSATVSSGTTVTCTLTVDGKTISTHTAHGSLATATCAGSNP